MPHSHGLRGGTRHMFQRDFRKHGVNQLSTYLIKYKLGDYVDIKANPSVHKGMPFRGYHGRTGRIFNITKRAVGVRVNKQVNGRILRKSIIVRVEHIKPSGCRAEIKRRIKENDAAKLAHKNGGPFKILKRLPTQPKEAFVLETKGVVPETIQALPFVDLL